jgi:hypothetical protein
MREFLTGIEARNQGIAELCAEIAPERYRIVIAHDAIADEDLDAYLTENGPVDGTGRSLWVYGSTVPRPLMGRSSKVQVHEPFRDDETPEWFDQEFPRYVRDTTVPGFSVFSAESLTQAGTRMLEEFCRVRLKDPNGASGVGQSTISTV